LTVRAAPANLERLTQGTSIVKACISAHECDACRNYDLAPALRAAVWLIDEAQAGDRLTVANRTKLLEAGGILRACIVTDADGAHGLDWDLAWPLLPAVRLLDDVIADLRPAARRVRQ
jgi:hypothetical protein